MKAGDKIPLMSATKNGKNPFAKLCLADFCTYWDDNGHCVSFVVEVRSEHKTGGYYMVKLAGGKVTKLKKKLLKTEFL